MGSSRSCEWTLRENRSDPLIIFSLDITNPGTRPERHRLVRNDGKVIQDGRATARRRMALSQPGFWACVPASMPPGSGYGFFIYGVKQPVLDVSVSPLSSHGPVSACVEPLLRRCILGWAPSSFHATHVRASFLITCDRQCASRFFLGVVADADIESLRI
jgi:hypothetical protein